MNTSSRCRRCRPAPPTRPSGGRVLSLNRWKAFSPSDLTLLPAVCATCICVHGWTGSPAEVGPPHLQLLQICMKLIVDWWLVFRQSASQLGELFPSLRQVHVQRPEGWEKRREIGSYSSNFLMGLAGAMASGDPPGSAASLERCWWPRGESGGLWMRWEARKQEAELGWQLPRRRRSRDTEAWL